MDSDFVSRVVCPCCEGSQCKVLREVEFSDESILAFISSYYEGRIPLNVLSNNSFIVVKCCVCGFLYQKDVLSDENMFFLYEKWISADVSLQKSKQASLASLSEYCLEIGNISRFLKSAPCDLEVLDFGMGWGRWSHLASAYNYNVTGVELSELRMDHARNLGFKVVASTKSLPSNKFDYIYSNQVFEHIPNPREAIEELARVLKVGGVIHLQVPRVRGVERKLSSKSWVASKDSTHPLEHVNCFSGSSFSRLAECSGLSIFTPLYRPTLSTANLLLMTLMRHLYGKVFGSQIFMRKE